MSGRCGQDALVSSLFDNCLPFVVFVNMHSVDLSQLSTILFSIECWPAEAWYLKLFDDDHICQVRDFFAI